MRATLNIPDELLSEVQRITKERSKTKAIVIAMQEFVRHQKVEELIAMAGKIGIEDVTGELEGLEMEEMEEDDKRWRDD